MQMMEGALDWRPALANGKISVADAPDSRDGIAASVIDLVGSTPMVYLDKVAGGLPGRVAAKLEMFEPLGSVKDRIALGMIEGLEREGIISPGKSTLLEVTSGNTGVGLAFVAAAKGYRLQCIMPDVLSFERRVLMLALGAELFLTAKEDGLKGVFAKAEEMLAADPSLVPTQQFQNPNNPAAHYHTTGPEVWRQTGGRIDAFVAGIGTGGTITGVGAYLKERKAGVSIVGVEPAEAPFLTEGRGGPHGIQGIGAGIAPPTLDRSVMDECLTVTTPESIAMALRLAREEGILAGISSGAAVAAAVQVASRPESAGKLVVALLPSSGERYLTTPLFAEASERAASLPVWRMPQPLESEGAAAAAPDAAAQPAAAQPAAAQAGA